MRLFVPCRPCCSCTIGEDRFNCKTSVDDEYWDIKSGTWTLIDQTPFYCGQSQWQWLGGPWIHMGDTCTDDCTTGDPPTGTGFYGQVKYTDCKQTTNTNKVLWTWNGTDWTSSTDNCIKPSDETTPTCEAALTKPTYDGTTIGETVWQDCKTYQKLSGSGGHIIWEGSSQNDWQYMSVVVKGSAGDKPRIIYDYVDEDNYKFAEWTIGNSSSDSTVALYERSSGSNTQITSARSTIVEDAATTLKLCITPNPNNENERLVTASPGYVATYTTVNSYVVGLGVDVGTVVFDNMLLHRHRNTGNDASCNGCLLGGNGCFPNCSSNYTLDEFPITYNIDTPCVILTGPIDQDFEFTLMRPNNTSTAIQFTGYFHNTTDNTNCTVQVYNYVTGSWEIPPWSTQTYAYQERQTDIVRTTTTEAESPHDVSLRKDYSFGIHHQHFDSTNHCQIKFTSTVGKLVIYRLNAGGEYYHTCTRATINGASVTDDCGCQYCGETNGEKYLMPPSSSTSLGCHWIGTVCRWDLVVPLMPCYSEILRVFRRGKYLVFEGLGITSQIDITDKNWDTDTFTMPFTGGDGRCTWTSPSLTIQKQTGFYIVTDCGNKPVCDECNGPLYPSAVEVTFDKFAPLWSEDPCHCADANGTYLLTPNLMDCGYEYNVTPIGCLYEDPNHGSPTNFKTFRAWFYGGSFVVTAESHTHVFSWGMELNDVCNGEYKDCLFSATSGEFDLPFCASGGIPKVCSWDGYTGNNPVSCLPGGGGYASIHVKFV